VISLTMKWKRQGVRKISRTERILDAGSLSLTVPNLLERKIAQRAKILSESCPIPIERTRSQFLPIQVKTLPRLVDCNYEPTTMSPDVRNQGLTKRNRYEQNSSTKTPILAWRNPKPTQRTPHDSRQIKQTKLQGERSLSETWTRQDARNRALQPLTPTWKSFATKVLNRGASSLERTWKHLAWRSCAKTTTHLGG
jgi:hypothetical protein